MGRDEAVAALRRQIEARGALPLADATAALMGLGIQGEAEISEILSDGLGCEWDAQRDSSGVVLRPLRSPRAPSGLPWETTGGAAECWCCGAEEATRTREGTPICEVCWVVLDMGSAR